MSQRGVVARASHRDIPRASDGEVMAQLAAGDIGALGELYDRHQASLRRFIARVTGDAEDVDDLVHAVFLAAAEGAARYDGRPSSRPWLMGIAVRLVRRRRHAFGRLVSVLSSLRVLRTGTADPRPGMQTRTDLERALAGLSEAKRMAVLLAEVEGLSCPEIAEALGVPVGTVWTRLHAARRELRAALEEATR